MSIWDSYDVDDGVEVSGESSAGFSGGLSMDDSRRISGPGDVYAVQGYSGSGGYAGANYIYSRDASQTLVRGTARLTPDTLGAIQDVSIKDADLSAIVSTGDRGGRGAMQHAFVLDGSLDSIQTIDIDGGIATSQDTQMTGFLPTAFGTAGYMNADLGPGTLNLEGEGAAVAVSSLDLAGPAEVDCRLATGTGNSAWAFGDVRSASSDLGAVGAGAGAGKVNLEVDLTGGLPGLYIGGEGEVAGTGVAAAGKKNEISGTLAAGTGFSGTDAFAEDVEASNKNGIAVAAAAAGGLGGVLDLKNLAAVGGAEGAIFGAGAAGQKNHVGVGSVEASTGNGAEVVARDVDASSREGAAGTGVAAGNVQVALAGATTITGEGSAVGAGAVGFKAYAGADRLRAKSGDSTSAAGKGLTTSIVDGVAGAGAIGATYDSKGPGSGWEVASVEGDITGIGEISGDFRANTDQSATARANNVFAEGNDVHLGSHADDGTSSSDADTTFSGYFSDGKLKAYAGDSTLALQKGRISGLFEMEAEADSFDPPEHKSRYKGWFFGDYDIDVKAWTDETGAHAKAKKEKV